MRRVFERALLVRPGLLAATLWLTGLSHTGCGGRALMTIALEPALDDDGTPFDTSALRALTVIIDNGEGPYTVALTIERESQMRVDPIEVDAIRPVLLDVWGCDTPTSCDQGDASFRGCTPTPVMVQTERELGVRIFMHPVDDERLAACPGLQG